MTGKLLIEWYKQAIKERKTWDDWQRKWTYKPRNSILCTCSRAVYRNSDPSDIVVTAAGGLVGEVVQIWKPKNSILLKLNGDLVVWVMKFLERLVLKWQNQIQDVIVFIGDGSYLLQNSDIYSSVIYDKKLIIVVCDNGGHMVINRLQLAKGGKEYLCNLKAARASNLQFVDFEAHAKSMGNSETVKSISELEAAFKEIKDSDKKLI